VKIFLIPILCIGLTGCAGFGKKMKSFLGSSSSSPESQQKTAKVKFSDSPNLAPKVGNKQYRRVNKEIFEKEGMLDESSGSLWVMEGQGSYLFSQNLMRVSGDVLNINLDGVPKTSLEKKVDIIKSLLERTRRQSRYPAYAAQGPQQPGAPANQPSAPTNAQPPPAQARAADAQPGAQAANAQAAADDKAEADEEKKSTFDVGSIPSRIVEKTQDGSYRIKGSQSFMIGRKEYRVIATGLVRPADIRNDSVDSSKMVDSKFDIVAIRKETK